MQADLFAIARSNGPKLEERLDQARAAVGSDVVDRFCEEIRGAARVTINMGSWKLLTLLDTNQYPTAYDRAKQEAARTGREPEQVLREQQGSYYERRVRFDRHFADGERFVYGALNLQGVGPRYYGLYCVALKAPAQDGRLALLPGNSLELYVDQTGEHVDEPGVARDAGAWSHRSHVAACKHADALTKTDPTQWPDMICSPVKDAQRFIEAVLGDAVQRDCLEEIRIASTDSARLRQILLRALSGEVLATDEHCEHEGQLSVLEALKRAGLTHLYREV